MIVLPTRLHPWEIDDNLLANVAHPQLRLSLSAMSVKSSITDGPNTSSFDVPGLTLIVYVTEVA